jgi:hypothetical protein
MDTAIRYIELKNAFVEALLTAYKSVEVINGRKFDRIATNDAVRFFIDKESWKIYGAKSAVQYNPRREYGSLAHVNEYDWQNNCAKPGTTLGAYLEQRELDIASNYKKRGRPRKVLVGAP